MSIPVQVFDSLTGDEFFKSFRNKKPVVLRNVTREWSLEFDSKAYWQSLAAADDQPQRIFLARDNVHFADADRLVAREALSLPSFFHRFFEHPNGDFLPPPGHDCCGADFTSTLRKQPADSGTTSAQAVQQRMYFRAPLFPDVLSRISPPAFVLHRTAITGGEEFNDGLTGLWFSSHGCITPLHYDVWHGMLTQLSGRKTVVLFSQKELGPSIADADLPHVAKFALEAFDQGDPALVRKYSGQLDCAIRHVCVLHPGESLYIPPYWWHHVTSDDRCISLTFRWDINPAVDGASR